MSPLLVKSKILLAQLLCAIIISYISPVTAKAELVGRWILDENQSETATDMLKKKFRRLKPGQTRPYGMRDPTGTTAEGALENYWRTLNEGRERRASKNLRRVGSAYPLITFTNLLIEAQPTSQHLTFTYEDSLTRQVIPNQNGRIYTAKGDELVADSIGHTLSYWIDSALFLETDSPTGGKYIEELKISKTNKTILHYRVKLNLPSLKEPVEIRRAFRRSN
jgi:hypothetical protein